MNDRQVIRLNFFNRLLVRLACYALPLLVFLGIWVPLILHYYVPNIIITEEMTDIARQVPADSVLDEIEKFFGQAKAKKADNKELIDSAEMVLQGKVAIPGGHYLKIGFPFEADDLDEKVPGWQLRFSRFFIPYELLRAYEATGRNDFLMAARDVILGFASYERNAWLPKGLMWNDHAIAARISVIAKFWKLYRNHPDYQSDGARDLFQLVARSAQLLAKPSHFNFATSLPNINFYKQVAFERMRDQMRFYVNDEGVVLEHSAGYQKVGLKFMGMAFKYLTLLDMPISEDWKEKYQKAEYFYTQLLRPNGSLPMFGDTGNGTKNRRTLSINFDKNGKIDRLEGKEKWIPKQPHSLYPVAGYSIWWNGLDERSDKDKLSQTAVAWSYFPGHAHKHADEMSVLLWAGGHNWWTNVGYWPYGTKGRSEAVSWAGSNAPHVVNEPTNSKRQTRLLGYGWLDSLDVIDLERKGPDEYVSRRQVLQVKSNLWIVLDHTFGREDQRTTTTWTTSHNINLSKSELPGSYMLETKDSNQKLTNFILTSEGAKISQFKGSLSPFAGWENDRSAPSIVVEQPAKNSWAATIWVLQESGGVSHNFSDTPFMENWKGPQNWQIMLPFASGLMKIWRENDRVFVQKDERGTSNLRELQLSESPQTTNELTKIHAAYENAGMKYSQKNYSMHKNLKATYFLIILFLVQEIFFLLYKRTRLKYYSALRGISAFGWHLAGSLWEPCFLGSIYELSRPNQKNPHYQSFF